MDGSLPDPPPPEPRAAPTSPAGGNGAAAMTQRKAGIAVVVGGLLVVLGVFLPWLTASGPGGSASLNGIKVGTFGFLILGAFAVARGMSMIRPSVFAMNMGTPLVGGALLAGLLALRWGELQDSVKQAQAAGLQASIGIGVWCVIAGTALILVGGVMGRRRG